jgi:hypothetical protein
MAAAYGAPEKATFSSAAHGPTLYQVRKLFQTPEDAGFWTSASDGNGAAVSTEHMDRRNPPPRRCMCATMVRRTRCCRGVPAQR